jgi:glycosyltransferase involved in cell wall biosynthesis
MTALQHPLRTTAPICPAHPAQAGLVSAIIPTYNRASLVGRSIESALAQTYRDLELVVVDDGSTDDTRAVVESYGPRVRYVYQVNAGVSAARNLGMRHARGEFVAFLDSDDTWRPWRIEAQLAALTRHPDAGLVWTDMTAVDENGHVIDERHLRVMYAAHARVDIGTVLRHIGTLGTLCPTVAGELADAPVRVGDLFSEILLGNLLHTSTVLVRRSWLERVGGFDPTFVRAGEDYEFYVRLCSVGPVIFIDAPSTIYRVGAPDQLTRPAMLLEIARNNLRAIRKWVPHAGRHLTVPPAKIRQRFADSYAWLGEAELEAGNRLAAVFRLTSSIAYAPGLDHRSTMLIRCALPNPVAERLRKLRAKLAARPA